MPAAQFHLGRLLLWMAGVLLSFSALAVSVRELSRVLSVVEILALRNAAGVAILLMLALARPQLRPDLRPRRMRLHALRNVIHFAAQVGWALGVKLLPLAMVFSLEFTAPAWVALFAMVLLGERMTPSRLGAVLLGFAGVLLIMRPGLAGFQPASLLVLAAAIGFAAVAIATKTLTRTESTFAILFWMNVIQLPLNLAASDPLFALKLDASHLLPVIGVAVSGLSAHYCLTNAFRCGDATIVVPLDFLRIPLIALTGWALYGEALDGFVFAGAGLIVIGLVWNLRAESTRR
jgi:drug/metabolite transporter (DMT)-like permease